MDGSQDLIVEVSPRSMFHDLKAPVKLLMVMLSLFIWGETNYLMFEPGSQRFQGERRPTNTLDIMRHEGVNE